MVKKKISVDIFPDNSEVSIKIDNEMYLRLSQFLIESTLQANVKDLGDHFTNILTKEPTNRYEFHMATLLILLSNIENEIKLNNLSVKKELEIDIDDEEPKSSETPD
jgi:hypothetical protein